MLGGLWEQKRHRRQALLSVNHKHRFPCGYIGVRLVDINYRADEMHSDTFIIAGAQGQPGSSLVRAATEIDAAQLLVFRAACLKERTVPYSKEASMAKVFATEAGNRACHAAVQILGGYGYIREYPVERHLRDIRVTTIYEGTSEIQRLVISRALNR